MPLVGYGTWPITHGSLCVFCNFVRLISQLKICDASVSFSLSSFLTFFLINAGWRKFWSIWGEVFLFIFFLSLFKIVESDISVTTPKIGFLLLSLGTGTRSAHMFDNLLLAVWSNHNSFSEKCLSYFFFDKWNKKFYCIKQTKQNPLYTGCVPENL